MSNPYGNAKRYFVTAKTPCTLEELVTKHLPDLNFSLILHSKGIHLNKKRLTEANAPLQKGDTVTVYVAPDQGKLYPLSSKDIHLDTPDFIVVHKPTRLTTVPDRSNDTYNLQKSVEMYLNSKGNTYRPQPMNRLDFMVAGLVIFSKNKAGEKTLFAMMKEGKIKKGYTAFLEKKEDHAYPNCLRIKDHIGFHKKAILSPNPMDTPPSKPAHSLFIKKQENATTIHYTVILFTGKRHQIRAHAATYLAPICGDGLYGSTVQFDNYHIALYCTALNFTYNTMRYRLRYPAPHHSYET